MKKVSSIRLTKLFAAHGIDLARNGDIVTVASQRGDARAEILLPESLPLELNAVQQLLSFAGARHPLGGHVCKACATPDFHAGSSIPVGSVIACSGDFVIPGAIGTDINCGLRLHATDLTLDRLLTKKDQLVNLLKHDLLEARRDMPTRPDAMTALFNGGAGDFFSAMQSDRKGFFGGMDFAQIMEECARLPRHSHARGNADFAPPSLQDRSRGLLRDPSLSTLGSGNHFAEMQFVDEVYDRHAAYRLGIRVGQVSFMVHTGSRDVGFYVGQRWMDRARAEWPKGVKHPEKSLFGLSGPLVDEYMAAMRSAAHYADLNRALIAEMIRQRIRQVFGDMAAPMIADVPHNIVTREDGMNIHRKGATPALDGELVLIPGSMGDHSYLMSGLGNPAWCSSASHGAGRAITRTEMSWRAKQAHTVSSTLPFECITLREERAIEEAPSAYKPIGPVIESQIAARTVAPIARMTPLFTFKS